MSYRVVNDAGQIRIGLAGWDRILNLRSAVRVRHADRHAARVELRGPLEDALITG